MDLSGERFQIPASLVNIKGGPFKANLGHYGDVLLDPKAGIATDLYGRTTPIKGQIISQGQTDPFGIKVNIGNLKVPQSVNNSAFHTKVIHFGV